jgi:hypothetical protein
MPTKASISTLYTLIRLEFCAIQLSFPAVNNSSGIAGEFASDPAITYRDRKIRSRHRQTLEHHHLERTVRNYTYLSNLSTNPHQTLWDPNHKTDIVCRKDPNHRPRRDHPREKLLEVRGSRAGMERVEEIIPGEFLCNAAFQFSLYPVMHVSMCISRAEC